MGELSTSVKYLSGVGPKRAELLAKELHIETLEDLIHFYPFRYMDRCGITRISEVYPNLASVQIQARVLRSTLYGVQGALDTRTAETDVESADTKLQRRFAAGNGGSNIKFNLCRRLSVIVEDESGRMEIVFFKGIKWNYQRLEPGKTFVFFGKPQEFNGRINLVHPDVDEVQKDAQEQNSIRGVYPSTEKLKTSGITNKTIQRLQVAALNLCLPEVSDCFSEEFRSYKDLVSKQFALKNIHFPSSPEALQKSIRRLKYEELFLLQLALLKRKYIRSRGAVGIELTKVGEDFHACYNALPYKLTAAQQRVIKEIRADMMSGQQMNRLLQGDVGSGKTMVAVLSCLIATGNGYQACIMAPTEVLAQQHYANIDKYLAPTKVKTALLTGSTAARERREIHAGLEDGSIGIIVGTHALIEDSVVFRKLALAVIDEQHRFGVDQRAKLWNKSQIAPHILVMTATPIPRTLAMTLYGDLDVSVINELPPGRKSVKTMCIGQGKRRAMYNFLKEEIAKGRQVFIVYPLIFESEKMDLRNLEMGYEELMHEFPLPDYKTAIVHGQQSNEDKNFNMSAFASGRANILVSTTVIEVGVDVPNASVMVIESAQRFGLSQLHQLRGRVGRGAEESFCILVKDNKTSKEAQQRLDLMCATQDGFAIAEEDMKMRGPGDLEGTQQSGLPVNLNIASLAKDGILLAEARADAQRLLDADPELIRPENERLARELRKNKYDVKDYSKIS